ncbi:MAG TPA: sigma 54-interacting transcriptional regulator, partial [Kofleriaceae bacterium]|nr:sigma 54-interacting transcriptional regulator [Kofleriaceae bacterium]
MADLAAYRKLPAIALIRDLVRSLWGVEVAFADARGYVLAHADGRVVPPQNPLCQRALASKEGFRRCNESVRIVAGKVRAGAGDKALVHECHLGFDIVAAPIRLEDQVAGFLFAGGGISDRMTVSRRSAVAEKMHALTGADADDTGDQLARAPRFSRTDRERIGLILERGAAEVVAAIRHRPSRARHQAGAYPEIIGVSPPMREVFSLLDKVCATDSTVLISGESGTGKELVARAIHSHGARAGRPFVAQNCSALNDNLLESALFGHIRGAFTGAVKDNRGLFQA